MAMAVCNHGMAYVLDYLPHVVRIWQQRLGCLHRSDLCLHVDELLGMEEVVSEHEVFILPPYHPTAQLLPPCSCLTPELDAPGSLVYAVPLCSISTKAEEVLHHTQLLFLRIAIRQRASLTVQVLPT